ncbi:SRPBCC family protein [Agromyces sp. Marseille-P2726]|uniref:SRPBCC family protein n=1 Tax=Agromyces sp. Marseille-P2726 TaxID=2709132 RepID=UPI00156FAD30|nr:SRPBCC family protein [Agromyces sp. Marseille-P2726]
MNTIEVRGEVAAPASEVWSLLGDFGGVASWNPFVENARIDGDGIGMTRTVTAAGGARVIERLDVHDDDARHIRYTVELESGARSIADIRLEAGRDDTTAVVWQSIREGALTDEQQNSIIATLRSRIDALAEALTRRCTEERAS